MKGECQGASVVFGVMLVVQIVGYALNPPLCYATPPAETLFLEIKGWTAEGFAAWAVDNPDIAACSALAPGWWASASIPAELPDAAILAQELSPRLGAALGDQVPRRMTIIVTSSESRTPTATAHGSAILLSIPKSPPPTVEQLAETVALATLEAHLVAAKPDSRASEQLLALGEALTRAGSYALVALPVNLRPVSDWLEEKRATPVLKALVTDALDTDEPWQVRRAKLAQIAKPLGAPPALAHAAAALVETFGDARAARERPFDLLVAWADRRDKRFPPPPALLRKALRHPLAAGVSERPEEEELRAVAASTLTRAVEADAVPEALRDGAAPGEVRLEAAARQRAIGNPDLCTWLRPDTVAPGVRTGCRVDEGVGGFVYCRAMKGDSFVVVSRSRTGEEAPLLRWPRWLLYPQVIASRRALLFVDQEGLWSVALDGHRPPEKVLAGQLRHLVANPDGSLLAAARWPSGEVVVIGEGAPRDLGGDGRGGVAWLENDVLITSDGERVRLVSLSGQMRQWNMLVPCCRALASLRGTTYAGIGGPCETALLRVVLMEDRLEKLSTLPEPPLSLLPTAEGVLLSTTGNLWRWQPGAELERIGGGLTPGPG